MGGANFSWMWRDPAEVVERMQMDELGCSICEHGRFTFVRVVCGEPRNEKQKGCPISGTGVGGFWRRGQRMHDMARRYLPEVVELLENWAQYLRTVPVKGRCRSIEHRYRAPSVSAENEARNVIILADQPNALLVESVVCNPGFPSRQRALLKAEFVQRADPRRTCRAHGLRYGNSGEYYEIEIYRASLMLQNRLAKKNKSVYKVNHKFSSPSEPQDAFSTLPGVEARPKQAKTRKTR